MSVTPLNDRGSTPPPHHHSAPAGDGGHPSVDLLSSLGSPAIGSRLHTADIHATTDSIEPDQERFRGISLQRTGAATAAATAAVAQKDRYVKQIYPVNGNMRFEIIEGTANCCTKVFNCFKACITCCCCCCCDVVKFSYGQNAEKKIKRIEERKSTHNKNNEAHKTRSDAEAYNQLDADSDDDFC